MQHIFGKVVATCYPLRYSRATKMLINYTHKGRMIMSINTQGKKEVLFLCTHNSARSQMAEGLLRAIYGERYNVQSAGTEPTFVDPRAVLVMKEIDIDISGQYSKSAQEFYNTIFDLAVTVCDRAKQACPICSTQLELPAKPPKAREVIHNSFEDPALASGPEEEQIKVFRRVRDEIREWIIHTFQPIAML
jgi:arsenate reductase